MIACVCGNVSEKKVRDAIQKGCNTLPDLQMELGVCCQCCCCESYMRAMLDEETS